MALMNGVDADLGFILNAQNRESQFAKAVHFSELADCNLIDGIRIVEAIIQEGKIPPRISVATTEQEQLRKNVLCADLHL